MPKLSLSFNGQLASTLIFTKQEYDAIPLFRNLLWLPIINRAKSKHVRVAQKIFYHVVPILLTIFTLCFFSEKSDIVTMLYLFLQPFPKWTVLLRSSMSLCKLSLASLWSSHFSLLGKSLQIFQYLAQMSPLLHNLPRLLQIVIVTLSSRML